MMGKIKIGEKVFYPECDPEKLLEAFAWAFGDLLCGHIEIEYHREYGYEIAMEAREKPPKQANKQYFNGEFGTIFGAVYNLIEDDQCYDSENGLLRQFGIIAIKDGEDA